MRHFALAFISLICLLFFLQTTCPARAAKLKLIDQEDEETVIKNPGILFKHERLVKEGLMVKKGKGKAILSWSKIKKIVFTEPYQAQITLKNGKKLKAFILEDQGKGLSGETDLGSFSIRLKHLKSIEVMPEKKTGVQKYTSTGPKVVGPMKLPQISAPKIKVPLKVPNIKLPGLVPVGSIPKPQGEKKNFVRFVNRSGQPATVRIFNQKTKVKVEELEVPDRASKGVLTQNGVYYIVTRYGETEKDYRYSKGKKITVQPPAGKRQVVTITLHKIKGGNYPTQKAEKSQFEGK
ncbi:hypothetical protein [Dethiosulfatarculus sandiegensis]|uniref:Uncharacterized protein n=1 Tax=Dethiosulfatarculus sandiegensis TaxID=1429043 RepID=A0A0D2JBM1_9BACT|nr:hypothetical protein [Dethiosulfatarculus sandiegensis]KIX13171.1 hypothetical protein X474_15715 [Dethiosulfatarculus sandiegensis]